MNLIIKNELNDEQRSQLISFYHHAEGASPAYSYIKLECHKDGSEHQLLIKVVSFSLAFEIKVSDRDFAEALNLLKQEFKAQIKDWHANRNI